MSVQAAPSPSGKSERACGIQKQDSCAIVLGNKEEIAGPSPGYVVYYMEIKKKKPSQQWLTSD